MLNIVFVDKINDVLHIDTFEQLFILRDSIVTTVHMDYNPIRSAY